MSVLTRLPADLRLAPADAARLLRERFVEPLLLGSELAGRLPDVLSQLGISGGAVYDALVALAAVADALGPTCPPLVCSEGWPSTACLRLCVRSARGAPEAIGTRGRLVREEQMVDVLLCDLSQARSASAMAG